MRSLLIGLVLAVSLVLAACGGSSDEAAEASDPGAPVADGDAPAGGWGPAPGAKDGPVPVEPDGGIGDGAGAPGNAGDGARVVEPRPGAANVRARPWDEVGFSADGTTATVIYTSGVEPCYVLDRVEVEESEDEVVITLFEGSDPDQPDAMCIEIAERKAVKVQLEEPVGRRSVVDGAAA